MCYLCTCLTHINIHIFLSVFLINDMFWWCVHAATTAAVRPMRLWTCLKVVVVRRQRATLAPAPNTTNVSSYFFLYFPFCIFARVCALSTSACVQRHSHTHTPPRVALIYSTCARLYFNGGQHKVAYCTQAHTHTHTNVIEIDLKAWTKV